MCAKRNLVTVIGTESDNVLSDDREDMIIFLCIMYCLYSALGSYGLS